MTTKDTKAGPPIFTYTLKGDIIGIPLKFVELHEYEKAVADVASLEHALSYLRGVCELVAATEAPSKDTFQHAIRFIDEKLKQLDSEGGK